MSAPLLPDAILCRASVLVERADACASGYERLGHRFSAELTRDMAHACRAMPEVSPLYEHWIGEQEQRLAGLESVK